MQGGEQKVAASPLCLICAQYDHFPAIACCTERKGQTHIILSQRFHMKYKNTAIKSKQSITNSTMWNATDNST